MKAQQAERIQKKRNREGVEVEPSAQPADEEAGAIPMDVEGEEADPPSSSPKESASKQQNKIKQPILTTASVEGAFPLLFIPASLIISAGSRESIKDCRLLMRTLVQGLKTIVWGISSCAIVSHGSPVVCCSFQLHLHCVMVVLRHGYPEYDERGGKPHFCYSFVRWLGLLWNLFRVGPLSLAVHRRKRNT